MLREVGEADHEGRFEVGLDEHELDEHGLDEHGLDDVQFGLDDVVGQGLPLLATLLR